MATPAAERSTRRRIVQRITGGGSSAKALAGVAALGHASGMEFAAAPPFPPAGASCTLVLGGARSGKSGFAERLACESGLEKRYLATAEAFDEEMRARIDRHRADRAGAGWITREAPLDLAAALREEAGPGRIVVVDCLTVWLGNLFHHRRDEEAATGELLGLLGAVSGRVVLVSNEVGLGLVPETPLGRAFRDAQGRLNQRIAALSERVVFVAAGLPLDLKR